MQHLRCRLAEDIYGYGPVLSLQQLRAHLPLGWGPPLFRLQQFSDLLHSFPGKHPATWSLFPFDPAPHCLCREGLGLIARPVPNRPARTLHPRVAVHHHGLAGPVTVPPAQGTRDNRYRFYPRRRTSRFILAPDPARLFHCRSARGSRRFPGWCHGLSDRRACRRHRCHRVSPPTAGNAVGLPSPAPCRCAELPFLLQALVRRHRDPRRAGMVETTRQQDSSAQSKDGSRTA